MSEQNLLPFHLSLLCLVFSPGTTVSAQLCVLAIPILVLAAGSKIPPNCISRQKKAQSLSITTQSRSSRPHQLDRFLLNYFQFINVYPLWGTQNWMQYLHVFFTVLNRTLVSLISWL